MMRTLPARAAASSTCCSSFRPSGPVSRKTAGEDDGPSPFLAAFDEQPRTVAGRGADQGQIDRAGHVGERRGADA